eukprot:jgi/Bigna1/147357/aug1.143_g22065
MLRIGLSAPSGGVVFEVATYAALLEICTGCPPGTLGSIDPVGACFEEVQREEASMTATTTTITTTTSSSSSSSSSRAVAEGVLSEKASRRYGRRRRRPLLAGLMLARKRALLILRPNLLALALELSAGENSLVSPECVISDISLLVKQDDAAHNGHALAGEPLFWKVIFSRAIQQQQQRKEEEEEKEEEVRKRQDEASTASIPPRIVTAAASEIQVVARIFVLLACESSLTSERLQEAVALLEIRAGGRQTNQFRRDTRELFIEICKGLLGEGRRERRRGEGARDGGRIWLRF